MRMKRMLFAVLFVVIALVALAPELRNIETGRLDDEARLEAPGDFAQLSDGLVHYQWTGPVDGDVVVLVHGFSVPSYTWEHTADGLAEAGYRVLTFDVFGRGWSDRPNTEYNREFFARQIEELLRHENLTEPVHIVGLSMGGAVVAAFAAEYLHRVRSVSLLAPFNTPAHIGPMEWPVIGEYLAYTFFVPSMAENQINDFVDPAKGADWAAKYQTQMQYDGFRRAMLSTARNILIKDPMPDFYAIGENGIPSLLIWGTKDATLPIDQAPGVKNALGRWVEYVEIPGAGHALQYEDPETVNQHLMNFFEKH